MSSSNVLHSNTSPQDNEHLNSEELVKLRQKCGRFRILVIGRANAGKTTLCQKMCNAEGPPIVRDRNGKKIDISPSNERGIHDINNEITYEANPGFVFHDSGGFESGSSEELEVVRAFIEARSKANNLREQLHAIWICLPVDDDRPLLKTEMEFFMEGIGSVPVIAIFTKCDGLDVLAETELDPEGELDLSDLEIQEKTQSYLDGLVDRLKQEAICEPKEIVCVKDMHKGFVTTQAQCANLIEKTAQSIDKKVLRLLLVSVQHCNMKVCIEYAIADILENSKDFGWMDAMKNWIRIGDSFKDYLIGGIADTMIWFPHFYYAEGYDFEDGGGRGNLAQIIIASLEKPLGVSLQSQPLFLSYVAGSIVIIESSFWHSDRLEDISICLQNCTSIYIHSQQMISVRNEIRAVHTTTMGDEELKAFLLNLVLNNLLDKPKKED